MEPETKRKYTKLLAEYKDYYTKELDNGKCICAKCHKLFRSPQYLKIHIDTKHIEDIKKIEELARLSPQKIEINKVTLFEKEIGTCLTNN